MKPITNYPKKAFLLFAILFTAMLLNTSAQSYLPLTGGTLTGNLVLSGNITLALPALQFNNSAAQPSTSTVTAIFPNNTPQTLDFVGWINGWRFVPTNSSSYAAPVVTIDPSGNTNIAGNTYVGKNLGIGTTSPNTTLDIHGYMSFGGTSGNLDPGDPPGKLSFLANSGQAIIGWNRSAGGGEADFISNMGPATNGGGFAFYNHDNSNNETQLMWLLSNGNLLIGKTVPQQNSGYKLDVNGAVRANAITVNTTGSDFVFESKYKLMPLLTLNKYIITNHHLPEIASAKEMQANGVDLAENQNKLLQKVEELTLYLIDKDKQLQVQGEKIKKLEGAVRDLEVNAARAKSSTKAITAHK